MQIHHAHIEDLDQILELFRNTISKVNSTDYLPEQVNAWVSGAEHLDRWRNRITHQHFLVAVAGETLAGFASLTDDACIDLLYVHHDMQGHSVGTSLLQALEREADLRRCPELRADVSITARTFFEKHGYVVLHRQTQMMRGVCLDNFLLKKVLVS